ncbi:MAG: ribonuclease P [Candidatus Lokiarchaeota archaeon]|nr:ribonuclease P [Candidatus Lokiarchaeota archaeon]
MPNKKIVKQIATTRIGFLFRSAHQVFPEDKELANRYVGLAIRYSQRARVKVPKEWKKRVCHKCKKFLYPGKNCRIRMQSRNGKGSHVSVTCLECNNTTRYFIKIHR